MSEPTFEGVVLEDCTCAEPIQWRMGVDIMRPPEGVTIETKDGVNADGRWHCLVIDGVVKSAHLIEPSQAVLDAQAAEEADEAERAAKNADFLAKKVELKAKKKGGTPLTNADVRDFVELMIEAGE
jgi:hypothetical protein